MQAIWPSPKREEESEFAVPVTPLNTGTAATRSDYLTRTVIVAAILLFSAQRTLTLALPTPTGVNTPFASTVNTFRSVVCQVTD